MSMPSAGLRSLASSLRSGGSLLVERGHRSPAASLTGRAAGSPICGGILVPDMARAQSPDDSAPYTEAAKKIGGKTPVWIFHGGDDPVVPVTESRRMNDAMKALGGEEHYTEYPGVGHNSWDNAYAEAELLSWMLSKATGASSSK